ncbi:Uncharacterized protein YMR196W [Mytilus edulis]|uniref:Uncharacterized protein YMR196W n=1 Tax=Mytilus edulis TaxID=6550 RepID=A0A8S3PNS6_MYTED|nr:Uncharacterized protein YMR196W [Mytilus edulis]
MSTAESKRLKEDKLRAKNWKRWGPYLSERQWGTVREDYSADGDCWNYFSHEEARSRAYRWGEDGLMGICDREGRLCLSLALWNTKDPILKERLFGLTSQQGNHGEDVKELYYYLDNTPSHTYMKSLYKYPQGEFPYRQLVEENARRGVHQQEYELMDTGLSPFPSPVPPVYKSLYKYPQGEFPYRQLVEENARRGVHQQEYELMDTGLSPFPSPVPPVYKSLYKYPQGEFPYRQLVEENARRGVHQQEYELMDTGIFDDNRYFDVTADFCKASPNDLLGKYTVVNRGPDPAIIHVLPQIWFRNVWSWGEANYCCPEKKPYLKQVGHNKVLCYHPTLGICQSQRVFSSGDDVIEEQAERTTYPFYFEVDVGPENHPPQLLFTENDTNYEKLYGTGNQSPYVKDAFHEYIVKGNVKAVNPQHIGTKCGAHYSVFLNPGQKAQIRIRLYYEKEAPPETFGTRDFDFIFQQRKLEADLFYDEVIKNHHKQERNIIRQAYAGLLWSKQFYYYVIEEWLRGDKGHPPPPFCRREGRNAEWGHLFNRDVISMPDKWEYPWYAAWDLAFHMIPMAHVDIQYAKEQLLLMMREWYMHPNGQIPAYEFAFDDVNPPVHCYAVLKVYKATGPKGKRDLVFLARCFHKLVLNFTWWINRKDIDGKNIFSGGFLGLDNIGVFDRSKPLDCGGKIAQADATAWVAFFCLIMLEISLILAKRDHVYEDMASKFFEHFVAIVDAINKKDGIGLWDEKDGFYYDHLHTNNHTCPMKILSMVGLVPLFSCMVLREDNMKQFPGFYKRTKWFLENRKDLSKTISFMCGREKKPNPNLLLAIVNKEKLQKVLQHLLNENEFLSPYGIRSLSKHHKEQPFVLDDNTARVGYEPGESESKLFGGNSNWRGPIWFPMNYLIIENLFRYDYYYGESLKVECPTGSGNLMRLSDVAKELSHRLADIFLPDLTGHRPCHGPSEKYDKDPYFKDLILFYEFFHGDTGRGCGASFEKLYHQKVYGCLLSPHLPSSCRLAFKDLITSVIICEPINTQPFRLWIKAEFCVERDYDTSLHLKVLSFKTNTASRVTLRNDASFEKEKKDS